MFEAEQNLTIPSSDVVSFIFDYIQYDLEKAIYIDAQNLQRSYSAKQARMTIRKLVAGLHQVGFKPGSCALINSMADIDYSILFLSIIAAGGVVCGSNPYYSDVEFVHQLKMIRPQFIFTEAVFLDKICRVAQEAGVDTKYVIVFDHGDGIVPAGRRSWKELQNHGESDWIKFNNQETQAKTIAAYVMSSGTTGLPKVVVLSHRNFVAAQHLAYDQEQKDFDVRRLLCLPQFATASIYSNHLCPIRCGEVCYVMPRFDATAFIEKIERFSITEISLMPPMVVQLLQHPLATKSKLHSLRYVHGGGAAISKDLQKRMKQLLRADTPFTQIWGMSEGSGIATSIWWPEDDSTGSIGRLIPNLKAKLVDEDGKEIDGASNARGEICLKGPTVMVGYLGNQKATQTTVDKDGWLRTGDICYCDTKTGKWYIVDRIKDLIKVSGFQVAPAELEGILLQHPGIADAAVIGINAPEAGTELPLAFVVKRSSAETTLDEAAIQQYVAQSVAKYKQLQGGVKFVDSIPKAPSGKILKNILREWAQQGSRSTVKL